MKPTLKADAREVARLGGQTRTPAKAAAARRNGALGGRPQLVWSRKADYWLAEVFATRAGWRVDIASQWSGTVTGSRWVIPYDAEVPAGTDLSQPCNDIHSWGDYLVQVAKLGQGRCLRRGTVVR